MAQQRRRPAPGRTQEPEDEIEEPEDDGAERSAEINRIVSGRLKRFTADVQKMLTDAITPLQEQLAARRAQSEEGEDPEEGEQPEVRQPQRGRARQEPEEERPPSKRRTTDGRFQRPEDPELANMRKKFAALEEERKAEKAQARNKERDGSLTELLGKAGVDPLRLRGAVAIVRDSTVYDDKAQAWTYRAKRDGFDEDIEMGAGVKEWAATDEGKSYLAPQAPAGRGAGTRVQQTSGAVTSAARGSDPKAVAAARQQTARNKLVEATAQLFNGADVAGG